MLHYELTLQYHVISHSELIVAQWMYCADYRTALLHSELAVHNVTQCNTYRAVCGTVQDLTRDSLGSASSTMRGISAIHTRNSAVPDRLPYFTYNNSTHQ